MELTRNYRGFQKGTIGVVRDINFEDGSYLVEVSIYGKNSDLLWKDLQILPWSVLLLKAQWDNNSNSRIPVTNDSTIKSLWDRRPRNADPNEGNFFLEYPYHVDQDKPEIPIAEN